MSIDTDYDVLRKVLTQHTPAGWAIEFGVFSGYSLRIIKQHMPVIGLDSFEGLPEHWREGFPAGAFAYEEDQLPPYVNNAMIIPGLFEDTLPMLHDRGLPDLGLVHIDCDLYSSTVTALDGVLPYISVGTYIVFDEYHGYDGWEDHEHKAWIEFCDREGITRSLVAEGEQERAYLIEDIAERAL